MIPNLTRRSSKGFFVFTIRIVVFVIVAVYSIWKDLSAWKILLRGMEIL